MTAPTKSKFKLCEDTAAVLLLDGGLKSPSRDRNRLVTWGGAAETRTRDQRIVRSPRRVFPIVRLGYASPGGPSSLTQNERAHKSRLSRRAGMIS